MLKKDISCVIAGPKGISALSALLGRAESISALPFSALFLPWFLPSRAETCQPCRHDVLIFPYVRFWCPTGPQIWQFCIISSGISSEFHLSSKPLMHVISSKIIYQNAKSLNFPVSIGQCQSLPPWPWTTGGFFLSLNYTRNRNWHFLQFSTYQFKGSVVIGCG